MSQRTTAGSSTRERNLIQPARSKPVWAFVEVGHPFTDKQLALDYGSAGAGGGVAQFDRRGQGRHLLQPFVRRAVHHPERAPLVMRQLPGDPDDGHIRQRPDPVDCRRLERATDSRPGSPPARTSGRQRSGTARTSTCSPGRQRTADRSKANSRFPASETRRRQCWARTGRCRSPPVRGRTHSPTATPSTSTASTAARPAACPKTRRAPRRSVGGALSRQRQLDLPARSTVLSPFAELCGRS